MKVLITGAGGFIGNHLTTTLNDAGHEVIGTDLDDADLRYEIPLHFDLAPDVCVHLAARVGRLFGEQDLQNTISTNAGASVMVARDCGERGIPLVYASTSEVYGDQGNTLCSEDSPLRLPHNLYGLSKLWGEQACQLYAPESLTILRISMPYGPGHPPGRGRAAITNMLWQAMKQQSIPTHRGAERSWCWIGDTCEAIRLIIEKTNGGTFNVGRDDAAVTMRRVAEIACELTGATYELIEDIDPPEMQTVVKRLATSRVRSLGWQPQVELREGMVRTLDWLHREYG